MRLRPLDKIGYNWFKCLWIITTTEQAPCTTELELASSYCSEWLCTLTTPDGLDDWTCSVVLLDLVKETACRPDSLSDAAVVGESESD